MNRRNFIKAGLLWVPFLTGHCFGQSAVCSGVNRPGVGSCTTTKDGYSGSSSGFSDLGNYSCLAQSFTAGSTYTTCKVVARMSSETVLSTAQVTAAIYTDNSGSPGYRVGYFSNDVLQTAMTSSEGDVTFTGLIASLTSGTTYWVVIYQTSYISGTNYFKWYGTASGGGFNNLRASSLTPGGWVANNGSGFAQKFTLYA